MFFDQLALTKRLRNKIFIPKIETQNFNLGLNLSSNLYKAKIIVQPHRKVQKHEI